MIKAEVWAKEIYKKSDGLLKQTSLKKRIKNKGYYYVEVKPMHLERANGRLNYTIAELVQFYEDLSLGNLVEMLATETYPLEVATFFEDTRGSVTLLNISEVMQEELLSLEEVKNMIKKDLDKLT